MAITKGKLREVVARLNAHLGRPAEGWTRGHDGKLVANIGHLSLEVWSPGDGWSRYQLSEICSGGGGVHILSPTCNAEEMSIYLRAVWDMLDGTFGNVASLKRGNVTVKGAKA